MTTDHCGPPKCQTIQFIKFLKNLVKQALLGALVVKVFNARLLNAATIIISVLLKLTIMFDAHLVDL